MTMVPFNNRARAVLALLLAIPGAALAQSPLLLKQTTISGGNTQLDYLHSYYWSFSYSGSSTFSPVFSSFVMKRGPNTSAAAILELYAADPVTGLNTSLLGTKQLAASAFNQSYTDMVFNLTLIADPLPLPNHFNVVFTSTAADQQNKAYFIKGNLDQSTFTFEDGSGNPISGITYNGAGGGGSGGTPTTGGGTTTGGGGTTTGGGGAVPEPGEWAAMGILGAGLTCLVIRKRRRTA